MENFRQHAVLLKKKNYMTADFPFLRLRDLYEISYNPQTGNGPKFHLFLFRPYGYLVCMKYNTALKIFYTWGTLPGKNES
jgi:hypothetical protein